MFNSILILKRSISCKCPNCKKGKIFKGILTQNVECSFCGQVFKYKNEAWTGPATINYILTTIFIILSLLPHFIYDTKIKETHLTIGTGIAAVLFSASIYRFVHSYWIHLLFSYNYTQNDQNSD